MSLVDLIPFPSGPLYGAAGSYPDMPSRRFGYDDDQTVHFVYAGTSHDGTDPGLGGLPSGAVLAEATLAQKQDLNDPTNDAALTLSMSTFSSGGIFWFMFFPEGREIDGYYWNAYYQDNIQGDNLAKSTNSTNGVDGTWTALGSQINAGGVGGPDVSPDYRNNIQTTVESNIVALAVSIGATTGTFGRTHFLRALHVYGTITPGNTPDRLLFLDPLNSDAEFTKPLDYGNIGRGTSNIRQMKIQNNSGALTANTVQVTSQDLIGGTPSGWFQFSTTGNDADKQGTLGLGNIGNGSSATFYVHLDVPDAAALGLYQPRIAVNQASWS